MQIKDKCGNCTKALVRGHDALGKPKLGCKEIFCIPDPVVKNCYHDFIMGDNNIDKNLRR